MRSAHALLPLVVACTACSTEGVLLAILDTTHDAGSDASTPTDATVDAVDATTSAPDAGVDADAATDATIDADDADDATDATDAGDGGDGSETAEAAVDAAVGDGALGTFSPPTTIDAVDLPDANNTDPSMTGDWRELYFVSDRSGNQDIWASRRDSADAAWGTPSPVAELNTPVAEQSPGVSFDGLTMWFARSPTPNQPQIWVTTRDAPSMPWSTPSAVAELDGPGTQISSKVDEDALIMFFDWSRMGTSQLYATTRPNAQAAWGAPTVLSGLGAPGAAADPFVAAFGLDLWFALTQNGNQDLYWAERPTVTSAFQTPVPLSELNTSASEADPALSPDFRYILFSSNRSGNAQIYQAWR